MAARFNLEPFSSAGYRRYFAAALLAALGLWVYTPALEWIVLTRTGLAGAVGVLQSALIIAVALATLPSGLVTARLGPRPTLAISLAGMGVVVALVAAAAAADVLTFELALVLTFVLGLFDGFFGVPAALLLAQVVEPRYLGAAIGLSFLTSGLGRLVGAPVGGTVLQVAGATQAFVPAAAILLLSAYVIGRTATREDRADRADRSGGPGALRSAAAWLVRNPTALSITVLGALSGATVFAYSALLPAFTRDLLRSESATLGLLSGAGGLGAIVAALIMDAIGRRLGRGRQIVVMLLASGVAVGALGLTTVLPLAVVLVALLVLLSVLFGGTAQLVVQTVPPPRLRAGVVAVYTFVFYVALPIGTASVGILADRFGVGSVLLGMAVLAVAGTLGVVVGFRRLLGVDVDETGTVRIPGERPELGTGAIVAP